MIENKTGRDGMIRNQQKEKKPFYSTNESKQHEVPHHRNCSKLGPLTRAQASNCQWIDHRTLTKTSGISFMVTTATDFRATVSLVRFYGTIFVDQALHMTP